MKNKIVGLLFFLAFAAGVVLAIGSFRSVEHTVKVQAVYRLPVREVWDAVLAVEGWAQWNPSVRSAKPEPDRDGQPVWTLETDWGPVSMQIVGSDDYENFETLVETKSVSSRWTWIFKDVPAGTNLTIVQVKTVSNPFLRGIMIFQNEVAPIAAIMSGLGKKLGLEVQPKEIGGGW